MKKVIALSLMVLAGPAAADNRSTASAFMECARISNDARRLACYDRLATDLIELGLAGATDTAPAPAAPAPTTAPGATPAPAPTTMAAPSPAPAPAAPSAPASPSLETSAAAVQTAPPAGPAEPPAAPAAVQTPAPVASAPTPRSPSEAEFGYERTADGKSKELKEIRSRHVGEFTGWTGKTVFRLENGQVWQQARSGRMAYRGPANPMIVITRGFMGGYQLSVEGVNKKVYVKRIE